LKVKKRNKYRKRIKNINKSNKIWLFLLLKKDPILKNLKKKLTLKMWIVIINHYQMIKIIFW
jgi:hypothetical protein